MNVNMPIKEREIRKEERKIHPVNVNSQKTNSMLNIYKSLSYAGVG